MKGCGNPCLIILLGMFGFSILGICVISGLSAASLAHESGATLAAGGETENPLLWVAFGFMMVILCTGAGAGASRR